MIIPSLPAGRPTTDKRLTNAERLRCLATIDFASHRVELQSGADRKVPRREANALGVRWPNHDRVDREFGKAGTAHLSPREDDRVPNREWYR